ncbi:MAG: hypothetical protein LBE38_02100 [Deltaproteobacteria bacterium]|jgi:hypothetical protein|nr:hypothetical protein [Deltaproteobacteria bacterium]
MPQKDQDLLAPGVFSYYARALVAGAGRKLIKARIKALLDDEVQDPGYS